MSAIKEIISGKRFSFGKNWNKFIKSYDSDRLVMSEQSLKNLFEVDTFVNSTFLDVGSGSGLFSLAANRMGAIVKSFDYDPYSVICTLNLKKKYSIKGIWSIQEGSILDKNFIETLGKFDYVYSWGVLHHTGNMELAFDNISKLVNSRGKLLIAIYNDQGFISKIWKIIKKLYCSNLLMRYMIIFIYFLFIFIPQLFKNFIKNKSNPRGMSFYVDMFDWLGGYPFEVSKPEKVINYFSKKGFKLIKKNTVGNRQGCNEFLFELIPQI